MFLLASAFLGLCFLASFLMGKRIACRNPFLIIAVSAAFLLQFIFAQILCVTPEWEYAYFHNAFYGHIQDWWGYIVFFYLGGLVSAKARKPFLRKFFNLLLLCILFQFLYSRYDVFSKKFIPNAEPSAEGYCYQSYHYTCGAAAACSVLNQIGILVTEKQMVPLCHTGVFSGTNDFLLKGCLNAKARAARLPGQFVLRAIAVEDIKKTPPPFLAAIKLNQFTNHWIVVLGQLGDKIFAFDPLRGEILFDTQELKSVWHKRCVVFEDWDR